MLTGYHRDYRGRGDIWEEFTDDAGEMRTRKVPGTIAMHCNCDLGIWMHGQTDEKIRHRIPTVAHILSGRGRYVLERQAADDPGELTDAARVYLRRWKDGFGGRPLPPAVHSEPEAAAQALHERAMRLKSPEGVA